MIEIINFTNRENNAQWYSFSIAGINITSEILNLLKCYKLNSL